LLLLPGLETRKCVSISVLNQSEELGWCHLPWISREIRMADRSVTGAAASATFPRDSSKRKERWRNPVKRSWIVKNKLSVLLIATIALLWSPGSGSARRALTHPEDSANSTT